MRTLVTGADGFVGRWLVAHLSDSGDEVWQLVGHAADLGDRSATADVRNLGSVRNALVWARPEAIYHLAGMAFGPDATRNPSTGLSVNVGGTLNVLTAASAMTPVPIILVAGSAEVYGAPPSAAPVTEDDPVAPTNLYGASKAAAEVFALTMHRSGRVRAITPRAFNHIGPGQRPDFVVSSFASQLAAVAHGTAEPVLRVGNLDAVRDFTDVRDVVRAYRLLVTGAHTGIPINIASGRGVMIRHILAELLEISGMQVEIVVDPARIRANDVPVVIGSHARLTAATGWQPTLDLRHTLEETWADALHRAG